MMLSPWVWVEETPRKRCKRRRELHRPLRWTYMAALLGFVAVPAAAETLENRTGFTVVTSCGKPLLAIDARSGPGKHYTGQDLAVWMHNRLLEDEGQEMLFVEVAELPATNLTCHMPPRGGKMPKPKKSEIGA